MGNTRVSEGTMGNRCRETNPTKRRLTAFSCSPAVLAAVLALSSSALVCAETTMHLARVKDVATS